MKKLIDFKALAIIAVIALTSASTCNQTSEEPEDSLCQTSVRANFLEQDQVSEYLSEYPTHVYHENDQADQAYEAVIAISAFGEDNSDNGVIINDQIQYILSTSMVANDDEVLAVNLRLYKVSGWGCAVNGHTLDDMLVKEVELPIINPDDLDLIAEVVEEQFINNPEFELKSTKVCNSYVWDGPEVSIANTSFTYRLQNAKNNIGDVISFPFRAVAWLILSIGYIGQ